MPLALVYETQSFEYSSPIGVGIPSVVIDGIVKTAANIDDGWIGYPGQEGLAKATGCPVTLLNDADVAAIVERQFGADTIIREW